MRLSDAKDLLIKNGIPFAEKEFENEADFLNHAVLFPYTANTGPNKVVALIIRSNNSKKDIELQFNQSHEDFMFEELWFGEYFFEMFEVSEECLQSEILARISEIMQGNLCFIVSNDLKKKKYKGDAVFERNNNNVLFGSVGLKNAISRIEKKKNLFEKLLKTEIQYEIYDWNNYRCVVK